MIPFNDWLKVCFESCLSGLGPSVTVGVVINGVVGCSTLCLCLVSWFNSGLWAFGGLILILCLVGFLEDSVVVISFENLEGTLATGALRNLQDKESGSGHQRPRVQN